MKNTPAPWRIEWAHGSYQILAKSPSEADRTRLVCAMASREDAKLIVAAPELIEACQDWLNDESDDGEFADALRKILAKVKRG